VLPAFEETALTGLVYQVVEIGGVIGSQATPQHQVVAALDHLQGVNLDTTQLFDDLIDLIGGRGGPSFKRRG